MKEVTFPLFGSAPLSSNRLRMRMLSLTTAVNNGVSHPSSKSENNSFYEGVMAETMGGTFANKNFLTDCTKTLMGFKVKQKN